METHRGVEPCGEPVRPGWVRFGRRRSEYGAGRPDGSRDPHVMEGVMEGVETTRGIGKEVAPRPFFFQVVYRV